MRHFNRATSHSDGAQPDAEPGLFRREALDTGSARTVTNLFENLARLNRGQLIAEQPDRHLQGTALHIERTEGHGTWELYRLDQGLYVVVADGTYGQARFETVPGEGLVEFHLRLTGTLELTFPGATEPVTVAGPQLLILYQPEGVDVTERVVPNIRDTCVSLFCRPQLLANLARNNGVENWWLLEEIEKKNPRDCVWHNQMDLPPALLFIGKSLLESPYRRGLRLMHAEAKALELLCEFLSRAQDGSDTFQQTPSDNEARRLEGARRLVAAHLDKPLRICEIAKSVGMSESKLKRAFKARFGATIFDYGLECRMRHALDLLRGCRLSVGEVAYRVGYRHQTSFAAAFQDYFGFLPSKARTDMH